MTFIGYFVTTSALQEVDHKLYIMMVDVLGWCTLNCFPHFACQYFRFAKLQYSYQLFTYFFLPSEFFVLTLLPALFSWWSRLDTLYNLYKNMMPPYLKIHIRIYIFKRKLKTWIFFRKKIILIILLINFNELYF